MALYDKRDLKGEPATVVFELYSIKTPKIRRQLTVIIYKLDNAPMWVVVTNGFIQETFPEFESAVKMATDFVLTC